jgi:nucleoside-diphosphate-sugar epimerase
MSQPLLLDEMLGDNIAKQLRAQGHDVISIVADPALIALPDDQVLACAASEGRTLVTANIKDFVPLDGRYRAAGQAHAGVILISTKTFPQNRGFTLAVTAALADLLDGSAKIQPGQVIFLTRRQTAPVGAGDDPEAMNSWRTTRII